MNENKPFWDENRRRYAKILAWAIVVLVILIADVLGLQLPIDVPDPPIDDVALVIDSVLEDDTTFTTLATTGNAVIGGDLILSSGDYPMEYASGSQQLVVGTDVFTTTESAAHGLTTVTFALCTLGEDPESSGADAAMCTVSVSGNVVTVDIWQDDLVTASTEASVIVHWLVVGTP